MGSIKERKEGEATRAPSTNVIGGRDVMGDHDMEKFPDNGHIVAQGGDGLATLTPHVQGHISGGGSECTGLVCLIGEDLNQRNREEALETGSGDLDRGRAIHLKAVDAPL